MGQHGNPCELPCLGTKKGIKGILEISGRDSLEGIKFLQGFKDLYGNSLLACQHLGGRLQLIWVPNKTVFVGVRGVFTDHENGSSSMMRESPRIQTNQRPQQCCESPVQSDRLNEPRPYILGLAA